MNGNVYHARLQQRFFVFQERPNTVHGLPHFLPSPPEMNMDLDLKPGGFHLCGGFGFLNSA